MAAVSLVSVSPCRLVMDPGTILAAGMEIDQVAKEVEEVAVAADRQRLLRVTRLGHSTAMCPTIRPISTRALITPVLPRIGQGLPFTLREASQGLHPLLNNKGAPLTSTAEEVASLIHLTLPIHRIIR